MPGRLTGSERRVSTERKPVKRTSHIQRRKSSPRLQVHFQSETNRRTFCLFGEPAGRREVGVGRRERRGSIMVNPFPLSLSLSRERRRFSVTFVLTGCVVAMSLMGSQPVALAQAPGLAQLRDLEPFVIRGEEFVGSFRIPAYRSHRRTPFGFERASGSDREILVQIEERRTTSLRVSVDGTPLGGASDSAKSIGQREDSGIGDGSYLPAKPGRANHESAMSTEQSVYLGAP